MKKSCSFDFVARADAHVLILGTLPGAESLRQQQYYAKKQNAFWRIMGALIGAGPDVPYEKRLGLLRKRRIALWDVCASAHRPGSLDSEILFSSVRANDFISFFEGHKHIRGICFNGQFAEKLFRRKVLAKLPPPSLAIRREILPSTSPAHAGMTFEKKLARWRAVLGEFIDLKAG